MDHNAKEVGLLSSRIFPAFYFHIENGVVDVVLTTHVDDFPWACTESGHAIVDRLLTRFDVGRKEEGRLRFCGKQFDFSGHNILLDVADNTRKTTYVEIAKHRNPADPVTKGEEKRLRSVVGSLSWIARQARPVILYRVSKLQSSVKGATVSTLKVATTSYRSGKKCDSANSVNSDNRSGRKQFQVYSSACLFFQALCCTYGDPNFHFALGGGFVCAALLRM